METGFVGQESAGMHPCESLFPNAVVGLLFRITRFFESFTRYPLSLICMYIFSSPCDCASSPFFPCFFCPCQCIKKREGREGGRKGGRKGLARCWNTMRSSRICRGFSVPRQPRKGHLPPLGREGGMEGGREE